MLLEYWNIKILLKIIIQIGLKKFLWLKKLQTLFHVITDLNGEEIFETFHEKKIHKRNQKKFITEEIIKKAINYMDNRKDKITCLRV